MANLSSSTSMRTRENGQKKPLAKSRPLPPRNGEGQSRNGSDGIERNGKNGSAAGSIKEPSIGVSPLLVAKGAEFRPGIKGDDGLNRRDLLAALTVC